MQGYVPQFRVFKVTSQNNENIVIKGRKCINPDFLSKCVYSYSQSQHLYAKFHLLIYIFFALLFGILFVVSCFFDNNKKKIDLINLKKLNINV